VESSSATASGAERKAIGSILNAKKKDGGSDERCRRRQIPAAVSWGGDG
jgi:hypothetical protein